MDEYSELLKPFFKNGFLDATKNFSIEDGTTEQDWAL